VDAADELPSQSGQLAGRKRRRGLMARAQVGADVPDEGSALSEPAAAVPTRAARGGVHSGAGVIDERFVDEDDDESGGRGAVATGASRGLRYAESAVAIDGLGTDLPAQEAGTTLADDDDGIVVDGDGVDASAEAFEAALAAESARLSADRGVAVLEYDGAAAGGGGALSADGGRRPGARGGGGGSGV